MRLCERRGIAWRQQIKTEGRHWTILKFKQKLFRVHARDHPIPLTQNSIAAGHTIELCAQVGQVLGECLALIIVHRITELHQQQCRSPRHQGERLAHLFSMRRRPCDYSAVNTKSGFCGYCRVIPRFDTQIDIVVYILSVIETILANIPYRVKKSVI